MQLTDLEAQIRGTHATKFVDTVTVTHDTPVNLAHDTLVAGAVTCTSPSGLTTYTQSDNAASGDFFIDYAAGTITANSTGAITDGETVVVTYEYDPYKNAVTLGLNEIANDLNYPREFEFTIAASDTEIDLPFDFLFEIKLRPLTASYAVHPLVPGVEWFCEAAGCNPYEFRLSKLYNNDGALSGDYCLQYAAGFMVDENGDVALPPRALTAFLYKAHAIALLDPMSRTVGSLASIGAGLSNYSYGIGDERVTKAFSATTSTANRATLAGILTKAYNDVIAKSRTYGTRVRYGQ